MTDKDLRRMSRGELIEIIYEYRMKTDELTAENEKLTNQLNERIIKINEAGSIAEAALSLSSIFEAAQMAADQYLESVRAFLGSDAQSQADAIIEQAKKRAEDIENQAQKKYDEIIAKALKDSE